MPTRVPCPSCGARLPDAATVCPHCHAPVDELLLEPIEVVSVGGRAARRGGDGGGSRGRDIALGDRRGDGRRSPWVVGGIVVAVLAAAVVVGRSGRDDSSSTATTSSPPTLPATSARSDPLPSSSVDGRPRPGGASPGLATERQVDGLPRLGGSEGGATATTPTTALTSAPPAVPAVPAGPPVTLPALTEDDTFTPFLPVHTGVVAYGLDADRRLVRVDVDRGSVSRRVLTGVAAGAGAPLVARTAGVLVRPRDGTAVLVPDDPSRPAARLVLTGDSWFLPAADPTEIWELTPGSVLTAQRLRLDGSIDGPLVTVPPGASPLGDDGLGNLLVVGIDGAYVLEPGQATKRVTAGRLLAWSPAAYVDAVCDDAYACHWRVTDRATGTASERGPLPGGVANGRAAVLSPDGTQLAVAASGAGEIVVTDLRSGQAGDLGASSAGATDLAWSRDGRWLLWLSPDGVIRAWSPSSDAPVAVDGLGHVPPLTALAVGPG